MSEIKITITAPELTEAINHLAIALEKNAGTPIGEPVPATPTNVTPVPVAPTTAPQYAQAAPATPNVNYPTDATQSVAQPVPVAPTPVAPTPVASAPTVPTSAPTFTLEMLSKAGADLVDMGQMDPLMMLLQSFGVEAITALHPDHYGTFATELRKLGAQI